MACARPSVAQVDSLQKRCDDRSWDACFSLGTMYEKGKGVEKDISRAATLYRKACDGGRARGCTNLGYIYSNRGDFAQALVLYAKGCNGGDAAGCTNLGVVYSNGEV